MHARTHTHAHTHTHTHTHTHVHTSRGEVKKFMMQALSNEDRKGWLEIMEGKEPMYTSLKVAESKLMRCLM